MSTEDIQLLAIGISMISAIAAAMSAYYSARISKITLDLYKQERKEKLIDDLNKILEIEVEYPYLASIDFTSEWDSFKGSNDERYLRYDVYCNRIFNYLNRVFYHFNKDKKSIEEFVEVKSWIRTHKYNWLNPTCENENIDSYDEDFRSFLNSYIK
jgi:predicted component of type VI protein secretion system